MTSLLEFITGMLDGAGLIAMALVIGGLVYTLAVVRAPWNESALLRRHAEQTLGIASIAAMILTLFRVAQLLLKPLALADEPGRWELGTFAQTQVFRFGVTGILFAFGLAVALAWLRQDLASGRRWVVTVIFTVAFLINEAWLSHAVSRVDGAGLLMTMTVIHMVGACVWAGGITHLLLFWRLRRDPEAPSHWPGLVSRFSAVGVTSVALIVGPGFFLAWRYVGDIGGLVGTGYGNLLMVKLILFAFVLVLAAVNFFAARRWSRRRTSEVLSERVPAYIEVEIVLASALLFTASALTSFPPAADIPNDRVPTQEMWRMFTPKVPHLAGPQVILIDAPELTDPATGQVGKKEDVSWDRFNHNVAGVIVVTMGILALLDRSGWVRWVRHWPLLFMAFGILIFVFSNPTEFPMGPLGFWESAQDAEVVQHWLGALVAFGLGWVEWQARRGAFARRDLGYIFPVLSIVGGIVLLTHSHNIFELKQDFLTQSTHVAMGVLAVIIGCARWLELRCPPAQARVAGSVAAGAMLLVGLILVFYVDPADEATWARLKG